MSSGVTVSLNCDRVETTKMAFEKAADTAAQLIRFAKRAEIPVEVEVVSGREDRLYPVRELLFQGKTEAIPELEGVLEVYSADSLWQECESAAEKILELVRGGCRYRDIGVVCTDSAAYHPLISMAFRNCAIPVYLSGTEEVLHKAIIGSLLAAMDAALSGFDRLDVLRYLKSSLSPVDPETGDKLENYAILWNIKGSQWITEWTNHPEGLVSEWSQEDRDNLVVLNEARRKVMDPLERLRLAYRSSRKLSDQVMAVYHFMEDIGLEKRLSELAQRKDEQGDNRTAQILNQLWEILIGAMEQLYDVLGDGIWDSETFVRLFALLLSQYDVGTIPPVLDAVMVGPVSAMRCQRVKHLFVLGAQEGNLPGYGGSAGILSDQERVTLRKMGVPLTGGAMQGIQAEFAEIYGVFCGAQETIRVSCPAGQPSYIYRRLSELSGREEKCVPGPGPALSDTWEAGAYLARLSDGEAAKKLGLMEDYREASRLGNFRLGSVERAHIEALYGKELELSASQVDRQAECRFSYFMKYGMRAKEMKEASIDPAEFGTYVHAVLEETAKEVMSLGGFHQVSLEQTRQIAQKYSDAYAQEHFGQVESERLAYLFRRNGLELDMVLQELWEELRVSLFEPEDFELAFGDQGKMSAIQIPGKTMGAKLRGFVDRVDIWQSNGNHYFRVVDYKTGKKDFDYCDVFNGVGLQMLLYLFALEQGGQKVIGRKPIPAGVQYFPARAPMVTTDGRLTEEESKEVRRKEWKRRGLLLADDEVISAMEPGEDLYRLSCTRRKDGTLSGDIATRQQLKMLEKYLFHWLSGMVDDIASGNVQPNPYTRGSSHDACAFCPYGSVCHKKHVEGRRNYKAMQPQRFWDEVEKEAEHG